jgi:putative holliday junction resolvase
MTEVAANLRVLAFDFGTQRVGMAVGNALTQSAQPLQTLHQTGDARWSMIERSLKEWQPDALVVGVPRHPDGAPHEMTQRCQKFARQLHGRFGLPVHEVDERYTSVEAESNGASDIDAEAARLIAEQFLRSLQSARALG